MVNFTTKRSALLIKTFLLGSFLYLSTHFLKAQPFQLTSEALPVGTAMKRQLSVPKRPFWQGFSFCSELGTHFKTLDFTGSDIKPNWGHDKRFWGEFGGLVGIGFKYGKVFKQRGYFGCKLSWTFFYPDVRWIDKSDITLSSIPLIGKFIRIATDAAGYYSMLFVPIIYLDLGYITENNIIFSLGSTYLWGLSPSMTVPLTDQWSLEIRQVVFLDRILWNLGYHNLLFSIGLNYKF